MPFTNSIYFSDFRWKIILVIYVVRTRCTHALALKSDLSNQVHSGYICALSLS